MNFLIGLTSWKRAQSGFPPEFSRTICRFSFSVDFSIILRIFLWKKKKNRFDAIVQGKPRHNQGVCTYVYRSNIYRFEIVWRPQIYQTSEVKVENELSDGQHAIFYSCTSTYSFGTINLFMVAHGFEKGVWGFLHQLQIRWRHYDAFQAKRCLPFDPQLNRQQAQPKYSVILHETSILSIHWLSGIFGEVFFLNSPFWFLLVSVISLWILM